MLNYYQAQGDFAQSCKWFAEKWGVSVILIVHNRKVVGNQTQALYIPTKDDIEGAKKVSNWADLILQIVRVNDQARNEDEKYEIADGVISIAKCRESGADGMVMTKVEKRSGRIVSLSEQELLTKAYRWRGDWSTYRDSGLYQNSVKA